MCYFNLFLSLSFSLFSFYRKKLKETNKKKKEKKRYNLFYFGKTTTKMKQESPSLFLSPKWPKKPRRHIQPTHDHVRPYLDTQTHKQRENDIWLNFVTPVPFWNNNHHSSTYSEEERQREKRRNVTLEFYFASRESNQTHKHTLYKKKEK